MAMTDLDRLSKLESGLIVAVVMALFLGLILGMPLQSSYIIRNCEQRGYSQHGDYTIECSVINHKEAVVDLLEVME